MARKKPKFEDLALAWAASLPKSIVARQPPVGEVPVFLLATNAGLMRLSIFPTWIACRFNDANRARMTSGVELARLNHFSGKYNFHEWPTRTPRRRRATDLRPDDVLIDPEGCVKHMDDVLSRILPTLPVYPRASALGAIANSPLMTATERHFTPAEERERAFFTKVRDDLAKEQAR